MSIKRFLILFYIATGLAVYLKATEVVTNPYVDLDYDKINVYDLTNKKDCICWTKP